MLQNTNYFDTKARGDWFYNKKKHNHHMQSNHMLISIQKLRYKNASTICSITEINHVVTIFTINIVIIINMVIIRICEVDTQPFVNVHLQKRLPTSFLGIDRQSISAARMIRSSVKCTLGRDPGTMATKFKMEYEVGRRFFSWVIWRQHAWISFVEGVLELGDI